MAPKNTKSATKKASNGKPTRVSVDFGSDKSMSVREIKNGFLVSTSGYVGKGKNKEWKNEEVYSATNPIQINQNLAAKGGIKFGKK